MATKKASSSMSPKKTPPQNPPKSLQYDLFSQFVSNNRNEVSNTVEIWESIPKYFFTPGQVKKLRTGDGLAKPFEFAYTYKNAKCTVIIQPALIKDDKGQYSAFFPGVTEELVEEALKKIFSEQQFAIHDEKNAESWVRFTLRMIEKQLKGRGRSRSVKQIKHAIQVMSSSVITMTHEGKEVWKGTILQDLITVGRKEYEEDSDSHHIARLPLFISQGINSLDYRQFNLDRLLCCDEQLARWIFKRLVNRFTQASITTNYHFAYSDLRNSGLLQQSDDRKNRRKVISALEELIENRAISRYETDEKTEGRTITEVIYTVYPSSDFIKEQTAANKRNSENRKVAQISGIKST